MKRLLLVSALAVVTQSLTSPSRSCSLAPLDIVLLVDSSGSVSPANYNTSLRAMADFTRTNLDIGLTLPSQSRVSVVRFSHTATITLNFSQSTSNSFVYNAILATPYDAGGTNIANGMAVAIDQAFLPTNGWRGPSANNFLIIITDGQDSSDVASQRYRAERKGITVFAVGVGNGVDTSQLVQATGSTARVFPLSNFTQIQSQLTQICQDIDQNIASSIGFGDDATTPHPTTPLPPPHQSRQCGTNLDKLWLDIVVIIDATRSAGTEGFNDIIGFVVGFFGTEGAVAITQNPRSTRLGLISVGTSVDVVANLTTFTNSDQVNDAVKGLRPSTSENYDLSTALLYTDAMFREAQLERPNTKKVVIVFSSVNLICRNDSNSAKTTSTYFCRQVGEFVANGWTIVSAGVKFDGGDFPTLELGWPCYVTRSAGDQLFTDITKFLPQINCFCLLPTIQFVAGQCNKFADCVHLEDVKTNYIGAQISCGNEGKKIADSYSYAKEMFLRTIALNAGSAGQTYFPFWTGLAGHNNTRPFKWDNGETLQSNDWTNWGSNSPVPNGDCVATVQQGFGTVWQTRDCRITASRFNYFCQNYACDTDNYCP